MVTIYEESRNVSAGRDGVQVTRRFRVEDYSDALAVGDLLLGGVRFQGGQLVRYPPQQDPYLPQCWCTNIQIEGGGQFSGSTTPSNLDILAAANTYDWAWITATYTTLDADPVPTGGTSSGNPPSSSGGVPPGTGPQNPVTPTQQEEVDMASESFDFSAQNVTLPNTYWRWVGSTESLKNSDTALTKTLTQATYTLTRHFVPRIPFQSISQMLGRINATTIRVGLNTFPVKTLRFDSANIQRKVTNEGFKFYEVAYQFAYRPIWDKIETGAIDYVGWNRLFRHNSSTPRWEEPVLDGDPSRTIYLLDNLVSQTINGTMVTGFNLLFHPGAP